MANYETRGCIPHPYIFVELLQDSEAWDAKGRAERAHLVVLSARYTSSSQCACVTCARFYLGDSQSLNDLLSTNTVVVFVGEGKERESVVPANLCIVVGCATKRARGYRNRRGKGCQLDVVCGTGLLGTKPS